MFGFVLTTLCTLMLLYVFWRAASAPPIARRFSRKAVAAAGAVLWVLFVLARFVGHGSSSAPAALLELVGMGAMVWLFETAVALFAVDLVTVFGFFWKRRVPALRGLALATGTAFTAVAAVQGMHAPVISSYEVGMAGLPSELDGTVLVALSDLHLGSLLGESWLAARVAQVQALNPDVVLLLGDVIEGHGPPPQVFLEGLRSLRAPLGVWAVTGNHESYRGADASLTVLEDGGAQVLHDRWALLRPGLVLAGVDDLTSRRRRARGGDPVAKALEGRPPGATVLLSHTPWQYDEAAKAGVGLMLCGHTHGGQVWPFGYLVRMAYPLVAGRYEVGGMTVIVTRGAGTWGPRMRLWQPGEILKVTLRSPNASAPTPPRY